MGRESSDDDAAADLRMFAVLSIFPHARMCFSCACGLLA
jgi:hypothetical protein